MSETHRRRVVAKIYRFARVGLHTSRRRAAEASAPLERAPTSERGVAGQLPRPARRSKKGPVRRGLRGASGQGRRPLARSCSFIIFDSLGLHWSGVTYLLTYLLTCYLTLVAHHYRIYTVP